MVPADDAISARRRLTNKIIAAHDAARLKPFFAPGMTVIAGDGSVISGAAAVLEAFAQQFRDADFVTYERSPPKIEVDSKGERAAEHGDWVAVWKAPQPGARGTYLACWRKERGQWMIESELFVTLA